jgi:hypothetical protein
MGRVGSPLQNPLVGACVVRLHEALDYQRSRFEADADVNAVDLLSWYAQWRVRVAHAFESAYTWTHRDATKASREGWSIYEVSGGPMDGFQLIQRVETGVLVSDKAALEHVYERARRGNVLHVKALLCDGRRSGR